MKRWIIACGIALALGPGLARPSTARAVEPPLLLAQAPSPSETSDQASLPPSLASFRAAPRGPGNYLAWWKLLLVLVVFWLWVRSVWWVDDDVHELKGRPEIWNPVVFFIGLLGLGLVWVVPVYVIGLLLFVVFYVGSFAFYVYQRNQTVPDDEKVFTPEHIWTWIVTNILNRIGLKIRLGKKQTERIAGPPVTFIGKSQGGGGPDPEAERRANLSEQIISAKELVYDALLRRATDIHLQPKREEMEVRYRIDGILHNAEPFERHVGDAVINIFKILSAMDIAERRKPQDGSFGAKVEGREIDFRVATSGSGAGEKLVMRILDKSKGIIRLGDLGMRKKLIEQVHALATQPHGMFIVCGPTGAGKSTTLYAALREIDRFQKNIITIEDPIEYQLENVTQIEINPKGGQTFATTLRSVLRQDPDVIMIGEVRDAETATISCQAATTGHMVFSTLHANDTVTGLFRMIDLGVEPFMLSTALSGMLSQRLIRLLCDNCKEPYKPKDEWLKKANLPVDKIDVFYRPPKAPEQVCPVCGGTGYKGRTGIFELLTITDKMRDMIKENPSLNAIKVEARKNGMLYLQEDGLRQVIQGKTSIQELMRVIQ